LLIIFVVLIFLLKTYLLLILGGVVKVEIYKVDTSIALNVDTF
jgi:hypothetical protein